VTSASVTSSFQRKVAMWRIMGLLLSSSRIVQL
jgi:hypothetical protein